MTAAMTTLKALTVADRCDRCGAAAQVRAVLPNGSDLLFCGHHAHEHAERLAAMAAVLHHSAPEN